MTADPSPMHGKSRRSLTMQLLCVLLCCLVAACHGANITVGTIMNSGSTFWFVPGVQDKERGAAYGSYNDSIYETGWGVLNVAAGYSTMETYSDQTVMFAAGMLEGILTHQAIYDLYQNLYDTWFKGQSQETIEKVKAFYQTQREWMRMMIKALANESDYWYYTDLIYQQFEGLMYGYSQAAPSSQQLDTFAFDFLCGNGDMLDIRNFLFPEQRPDVDKLSKKELLSLIYNSGHCSVLIKALPGYENIFASHSSWYMYAAMNRIFKHYAFKVSRSPVTMVMSFSSYPGFLSSLDDFYIMDSGLVMLQTTNSILNKTLYDLATSSSLLSWHRVRLANWLASSGEEWAEYVSQYNSGTYNNQYMVLDLKRVELQKSLHDDALWIIEQIPGYVESGDQTDILREGYWASYNVPFYEDIYYRSGYAAAEEKTGANVYQLGPRPKIFRRDQSNVHDLGSMEYIMRYNDYKQDPYSEGNPMNTICSRGDLLETPVDGGCYDTKVTDYYMAQTLTSFAENGPTHQDLPPFQWSTSGLNTSHLGQPDLFNFGFVKMKPAVP